MHFDNLPVRAIGYEPNINCGAAGGQTAVGQRSPLIDDHQHARGRVENSSVLSVAHLSYRVGARTQQCRECVGKCRIESGRCCSFAGSSDAATSFT